jgi:HAMP domain-containing protein
MLNNLRLGNRFNLILLAVFLTAIMASGIALAAILNQKAEDEITTKANLLMQTTLSVRNYTSTYINPELASRLETETQFLPQTVPAFSAREVFEDFRKNPAYQDFFYKEATLNPTNLRDKADAFETKLVEEFRSSSNLKELKGYRSSPGGEIFYIARPLVITKASCLRCHSTPAAAPKSQITTYGNENGFGWKLNEIIGVQVISVPVREVIQSAQRSFFAVISVVVIAFLIAILMVNLLLKQIVIRPLSQIARTANEVSVGNMAAEFEMNKNDEIGSLAAAFNRMKTSLVLAMDMLNQKGM